jgi:ABC-type glycerol-3-phosphate transport system permease component
MQSLWDSYRKRIRRQYRQKKTRTNRNKAKMLAPDTQPVSASTTLGATVQSYYAQRNMNIYPVAEHELESLSLMSTLNQALVAIGIGLISLAVGVFVTYAFSETVTPEGNVLTKLVAPLLVLFGVVALGLCKWTLNKRRMIWGRIVAESKNISDPTKT